MCFALVKISVDESLLGETILKSEDKEDAKEDPGAAELEVQHA